MQKHTVQSVGVYERIRRAFALDPNRSSGVPLNPYFRNPTPGSPDVPYTDPVTLPAGDIAGNPYWKRDARRTYPRRSVVTQAEQSALLTVGSAAAPRVELIGEAGEGALVAAKEGGSGGLAAALAKDGEAAKRMLELTGGLPPLPSGRTMSQTGSWAVHKYEVVEEQSYDAE